MWVFLSGVGIKNKDHANVQNDHKDEIWKINIINCSVIKMRMMWRYCARWRQRELPPLSSAFSVVKIVTSCKLVWQYGTSGNGGLPWCRRPCEVWIPYGFNDGQQRTVLSSNFHLKITLCLADDCCLGRQLILWRLWEGRTTGMVCIWITFQNKWCVFALNDFYDPNL